MKHPEIALRLLEIEIDILKAKTKLMHSRSMSRRAQGLETANVGIGSNFNSKDLCFSQEELKRLRALSRKKDGGPKVYSLKDRVYALWMKIKAGKIPEAVAANIRRDHAKEFAVFEKMGAMA